MDSRFDEMDRFIKMLAEKKKININEIYFELCSYGLSDEERKSNSLLVDEQQELTKKYNSKGRNVCDKIHGFGVFSDNRVRYADDSEITVEGIKLYTPTNKENLQEVVSKILDYFLENSVSYEMKVADDIRADDIVARIYGTGKIKFKDIIDFINNELKDKLLKTNPFLLRNGMIGIACDGDFSYNGSIARFLEEYLQANKDNLEDVGLDGFRKYMEEISTKVNDEEYMRKILKSPDRIIKNANLTKLAYLYNNKKIVNLINIALDKDKGMKDFIKHWNNITNRGIIEEETKKLRLFLGEERKVEIARRARENGGRRELHKKAKERKENKKNKKELRSYYYAAFKESGEKNFLDFLYQEKQKAEDNNNNEIMKQIESIINQVYADDEFYFSRLENEEKYDKETEKVLQREYMFEKIKSQLEDELISEFEEEHGSEEENLLYNNDSKKEEIREDTRKEIIDKLQRLIEEDEFFELSEEEHKAFVKMIAQNPHLIVESNYKRDFQITIKRDNKENIDNLTDEQNDEDKFHVKDAISIKIGENFYIIEEYDRDKGKASVSTYEEQYWGDRYPEFEEMSKIVTPEDFINGMKNESKEVVVERILEKQKRIKAIQEECEKLEEELKSLEEI